MTLQFALCNLHFAIAVRLSYPSGNRLRRLREYKTLVKRKKVFSFSPTLIFYGFEEPTFLLGNLLKILGKVL